MSSVSRKPSPFPQVFSSANPSWQCQYLSQLKQGAALHGSHFEGAFEVWLNGLYLLKGSSKKDQEKCENNLKNEIGMVVTCAI